MRHDWGWDWGSGMYFAPLFMIAGPVLLVLLLVLLISWLTGRRDVGVGMDGYEGSLAVLKRGGLVCAYGYTASVRPERGPLTILVWLARQYLQSLATRLLAGKRTRIYSINLMRAQHPAWFKEDLERLFGLLAAGAIRPRVAERISFDQVADAHRRLEGGGLEGKLVLCPDLPSPRNQAR
jgi:NADPH:quinone reductase-like Zn-dependent oxidoreductase